MGAMLAIPARGLNGRVLASYYATPPHGAGTKDGGDSGDKGKE
jgi:hypothetical protein